MPTGDISSCVIIAYIIYAGLFLERHRRSRMRPQRSCQGRLVRPYYHIDGDVHDLHEETHETHDRHAKSHCSSNFLEFLVVRLRACGYQAHGVLVKLLEVFDHILYSIGFRHGCSALDSPSHTLLRSPYSLMCAQMVVCGKLRGSNGNPQGSRSQVPKGCIAVAASQRLNLVVSGVPQLSVNLCRVLPSLASLSGDYSKIADHINNAYLGSLIYAKAQRAMVVVAGDCCSGYRKRAAPPDRRSRWAGLGKKKAKPSLKR